MAFPATLRASSGAGRYPLQYELGGHMIITRTPLRISFFGGGTDYPVWYRNYGGSVLSTTIDKSCYITCRRLPPFFEYHSRVSYSKV